MRRGTILPAALLVCTSLSASPFDDPPAAPTIREPEALARDSVDVAMSPSPVRIDESKGPRIFDPKFLTESGGTLEVFLVLDDGVTPVSGLRIEVLRESKRPGPNGALRRWVVAEHRTDARGIARFERVTAGTYVVAAGLAGASRGILEFARIEEGASRTRVTIRIRGSCDIEGRVESASGGCPGFAMRLADDALVRTDAKGHYRFEGVAFGGATSISVSIDGVKWYGHGDWSSGTRAVPLAAGVVTVEPLRFASCADSLLETIATALTPPPK